MRYCKNDFSRKMNNPFQTAVSIIILIVFAPIRFFSETSKKVIFLGEYMQKCLIYTIILCTVYMSINSLYGLFVTGRIYLTGGSTPIVSMIVSISLAIFIYLLFNKFSYNIDLDSLDDLDKNRAIEIIKEIQTPDSEKPYRGPLVDDEGTVISDPTSFNGNKNIPPEFKPKKRETPIPKGSTITEEISRNDLSMDFSELNKLIESSPKTEIDPLYKNESMEVKEEMIDELKGRIFGHLGPKEHITDEEFIMGSHSEEVAREINFSVNDLSDFEDTLTEEEDESIMNSVHEHLTKDSMADNPIIGDLYEDENDRYFFDDNDEDEISIKDLEEYNSNNN